MNTIQKITKDCARSDCSLSSRGGFSTCMGWAPTYDKDGKRTDRGDPNTYSMSYRCGACDREWLVSTQYNKTTITECARTTPPAGEADGQPARI